VDGDGRGALQEQPLHQLIRQPEHVTEGSFEIAFFDPGAEVYAFTFG
jgi:hypothetical protein